MVGLAWDWILEILHYFLRYIDEQERLKERLLKILADMEVMVERGTYTGSIELFFSTVERALSHVGESTVLRLMEFQAAKIGPVQPNWIAVLNRFIQR